MLAGYRSYDRGTQPEYLHPPYASTVEALADAAARRAAGARCPRSPDRSSASTRIRANDFDLTKQHAGEPIGERIVVTGRVLDGNARPVPHTLVEIWQANAAGRYPHPRDQHNAPHRSQFHGRRAHADRRRRAATASSPSGRASIRGATTTTRGARRTSTSRCSGRRSSPASSRRCTFPAIRCSTTIRCTTSIPDERARKRLVSAFDWETTIPEQALGYRFDIVLRGRDETPMDNYRRHDRDEPADDSSQTVGPYPAHRHDLARHRQPGRTRRAGRSDHDRRPRHRRRRRAGRPTRWSRSGRPTATAATRIRKTPGPRRSSPRGTASAACRPTPTDASASRRSSPAACRRPAADCRRRTST